MATKYKKNKKIEEKTGDLMKTAKQAVGIGVVGAVGMGALGALGAGAGLMKVVGAGVGLAGIGTGLKATKQTIDLFDDRPSSKAKKKRKR